MKWTGRGFGFIQPDRGGLDVFAHIRQLDGTDPEEGMRVEFEAIWAHPRRRRHAGASWCADWWVVRGRVYGNGGVRFGRAAMARIDLQQGMT